MDIAGKMMEMGIDYSDIIDNSFYKKSYIQNQILGRALLESVLFYDGRCIFSSVSIEEMNFYGGGHVRAAGFSAKGNVHSIVNKIGEMIEQQYNEDNA